MPPLLLRRRLLQTSPSHRELPTLAAVPSTTRSVLFLLRRALPSRRTSANLAHSHLQGGAYGSCGWQKSDSDYIVAMNSPQVSNGAHCGKYVQVTNTANGKSVKAMVADTCPGCAYGSLDLSVGAFDQIGAQDSGVLPIKWQFL
ncbi:RlpA-like double-psi beta-barrel-protein domain-containing protein-containing protein [Leucosporidium creatinivorum]|uniref:RlpA-like double-psi beta-barrel-protein domain-containing protein-containing protein n=1 Tax=Leucosporidium creatinivorum TaxID=106004 RepID=A0A1Y2EVZ5_9BASI|nr:RlpA-like double-psi beta-barrel-protein domain-containing protein-containing protein [Leucosporidium creatinivorum]